MKNEKHTVYFVSGNDNRIKDRLDKAKDVFAKDSELRIIYNETISQKNRQFIENLAKSHDNVCLIKIGNYKKRTSLVMGSAIREIHKDEPDARIVILSDRYMSKKMLELEENGVFFYGEWKGMDNSYNMKIAPLFDTDNDKKGRIYILIDYENVGSRGLVGSEYLSKEDSVTLFYSAGNAGIERCHIEALTGRTAQFDIIKLKTTGKNALDFYIATRVGQIAEYDPLARIIIISNDAGYGAVRDYCSLYSDLKQPVLICDDIEKGIAALGADSERHQMIKHNREKLSIESEYAAYCERRRIGRIISDRLEGTGYESLASQIRNLIENSQSPKDRYIASLREFGRKDGIKIYRIMREVV